MAAMMWALLWIAGSVPLGLVVGAFIKRGRGE